VIIFMTLAFAIGIGTLGRGTTQVLGSSDMVLTATSTSASNSSDNLEFSLQLTHESNGNLTVEVDELNLRDLVNNVTGTDGWKYSPYSINPFDNCAVGLFYGFAIASGNYDANNLTSASALRLYEAAEGQVSCSESDYVNTYSFQPMSDKVTVDPGLPYPQTFAASFSESIGGYWNASGSSFQRFGPGIYTVIGADQWGNVLLLHFRVVPAAA
jgi:hypothetical protein